MFLWTCVVAGYIFMMLFATTDQKEHIYSLFPPATYVSGFFGLDEYHNLNQNNTNISDQVESNDADNQDANLNDPLRFDLEEKLLKLYSPVYTFVGELWSEVVWFEVEYSHRDLDGKMKLDLWEFVSDDGVWTRDIWLQNELMQQWTNTYEFTVSLEDGKEQSYKKQIKIDFEPIDIDGTILYLDPYFSEDGKNIAWQEDDFDGIPTTFLMRWCGEDGDQVLIQHEYSYETVPACLSYSTKKKYLVYFADRKELKDGIYYTAISPWYGSIYKNFPLFRRKRWNIYQSLLFFNPGGQFVQIVSALGDQNNFETLIQHYNIRSNTTTMSLRQVNGDQIEIENGYEKVILYYFKDNQTKRSITYPWLRYKYYVRRSGSRRLINQGTVYHLDQQTRIPPSQEYGTSYRLNAWLFEDTVVVEDPFKHISYNITALARPSKVENSPDLWFSCKDASVGIYNYLWWDIEYLYEDDNIILLWEGRNVDRVTIQDSAWSTYEVQQHTQWYVASTIEPTQRWVQLGDITYSIIWYDTNGRELCNKTHTIQILEKPDYS